MECSLASSVFPITLLFLLAAHFQVTKAQSSPPLVDGLSFTFYDSTCPKLESIVRDQLKLVFHDHIGIAAGLLRLQFHDCFVKGCDGSVLLAGSPNEPSEQQAVPNLTLRPEAFTVVEDLRSRVHGQCGRTVSCADILTLAARDAVYLSGGPDYAVPLGRRDSKTFATTNETTANIPPPTFNTTALLSSFSTKNLDAVDLVALSGSHTIGIAHCGAFVNRLYPTQDPTMNISYAKNLRQVCPTSNSTNTTNMDSRTPKIFDNKYYIDLLNRQGLFTSDQDLYIDPRTRDIVQSFALDEDVFFEKYVNAIIKMGQISVLTGTQGEIRGNCSVSNSNGDLLSSAVDEKEAKVVEF